MKITLWLCWGLIAYAYVGYPLWLFLSSAVRRRSHRKGSITPTVSIVMAVRNEAGRIARKLDNLSSLDYPAELVQVVVVSDGSTDGTNELLRSRLSKSLKTIFADQHVGKAVCLNRALEVASGEIVVFTDVRQMIDSVALRELVANLADASVGCVSGELMFGEFSGSAGIAQPLGLYWRMEKKIRRLESETGSVVGATGALYAARRCLIPVLPAGTLLDDVYIPAAIARKGNRVLFEPNARAWDNVGDEASTEFRRKVRTLTGNFQLLRLAPWLLNPSQPLWFRFVSHKMSRLAVPWMMIASVVLAAWVRDIASIVFLAVFALLLLASAGAIVLKGSGLTTRVCKTAQAFVVLNAAAAMGFINFATNRYGVWEQVTSAPGGLETPGSERVTIAAGK
jgi:poly-beta-1,6-N-acetyl-D-glucosamine synthase